MLFFLNLHAALDTSFGTGGIVTTSVGFIDQINGVTLQSSDTHIVVAGSAIINAVEQIAVARYTPSGSLDSTFDMDGIQTTTLLNRSAGHAIDLQTDEKIVVSGFAFGSRTDFATVRYNTDGSLDSSFNSSGDVTTAIGTGAQANSVKVLTGGEIVAAGTSVFSSPLFTLAQYTSSGVLDSMFGTGGIVTTNIGTNASIHDIAIQSDGKIVAAGFSNYDGVIRFALARYNSDGSLDNSFGTNGIVVSAIAAHALINSVVIQDDGDIVVAGIARENGVNQFAIARYDTSGNLDTSFNGTGVIIAQVQNDARAHAVKLQSDGKIIVGGSSIGEVGRHFAVARYNINGSLDTTFGTNGFEFTTIGSRSEVTSLAIQPDDKIVAAGYSGRDFALARYEAQVT